MFGSVWFLLIKIDFAVYGWSLRAIFGKMLSPKIALKVLGCPYFVDGWASSDCLPTAPWINILGIQAYLSLLFTLLNQTSETEH